MIAVERQEEQHRAPAEIQSIGRKLGAKDLADYLNTAHEIARAFNANKVLSSTGPSLAEGRGRLRDWAKKIEKFVTAMKPKLDLPASSPPGFNSLMFGTATRPWSEAHLPIVSHDKVSDEIRDEWTAAAAALVRIEQLLLKRADRYLDTPPGGGIDAFGKIFNPPQWILVYAVIKEMWHPFTSERPSAGATAPFQRLCHAIHALTEDFAGGNDVNFDHIISRMIAETPSENPTPKI